MPDFADAALTPQTLAPFLPWLGGLVALGSLFGSLRACRRKRLIDNLPTSKTQGVFIGLLELKGAAQCERPLVSPLAELPCVYFAYAIEERWSRLVETRESDGRGGTRVVTRRETGWTTVDSRTAAAPFYLEDDTGSLGVQPAGARIEAPEVFDRECSRFDPLYYAKGPPGGIIDSDGVRRFTERALAVHAQLFIVGQARERDDVVAPEIAADPKAPEFLISARSQEDVSRGLGWRIVLLFALGAVAAPGGHVLSYFAAQETVPPVAVAFFALEFLTFVLAWLAGWIVTLYNSLVELRRRVDQGWGQVDIQLKRRHDLIPNLVDAVKGYRDHEATAQPALAALRGQLGATPPGQAGDDPRAVGGEVRALQEAYPALKADGNFLALQQSLSDTEQRIALARAYFNSIATFYNTRLETVPDRFIAPLGGMQPRALMAANDFERAPVNVSFASPASATPPPAPAPSS
ncbi:MAG: LemA family protein [Verrucomicrobiota bacterium]